MKKNVSVLILTCLVFAGTALSDETGIKASSRFIGGVKYSVMQFMNTTVPPTKTRAEDSLRNNGATRHAVMSDIGLFANIQDRTLFKVLFHARYWLPFAEGNQMPKRSLTAGISECNATFKFGKDASDAPFMLELGLLKFKYADESLDLGEYLLNSGTYPGFILSGRDATPLLGLHLQTDIIENFVQDILFTSEMFILPTYDYSLTYIGHYTIRDIVEVGAGVMFNRLISVNEKNTTPEKGKDLDPATGDSVQYTHAGIKVMGRAVFDPKPLFNATVFGDEDLKLYVEAAILGVKDYPWLYDEITERIPVCIGIHLPAFNFLDVLAVEAEWYGSPHMNNPDNQGLPFPDRRFMGGDEDNWKWAVSARKTLMKGVSISGRAASDHLRIENGAGWYESADERTIRPDQWYWMLEADFSF